jgi:hypothetical protein
MRRTHPSARFSQRIHDWNPDARIAYKAGVSLVFSGDRNEIHCPELDLRSRQIGRLNNMVTRTGVTSGMSGVNSYGSSGGMSASHGGGTGSGRSVSNSSSTRSASREESSSGGSGTSAVKK